MQKINLDRQKHLDNIKLKERDLQLKNKAIDKKVNVQNK